MLEIEIHIPVFKWNKVEILRYVLAAEKRCNLWHCGLGWALAGTEFGLALL